MLPVEQDQVDRITTVIDASISGQYGTNTLSSACGQRCRVQGVPRDTLCLAESVGTEN
jgi:hypothetical protein